MRTFTFTLAAAAIVIARAAGAQELEPRAYSPNPSGVNFVLLAYGHSRGDVVFDPSVPITDVKARINAGTVFYGRSFGLFGRSASAAVQLPYVWGHVTGNINGAQGTEFRDAYRSGVGDLRLRLTSNLFGGPALSLKDFAKRKPTPTLGASVVVIAPIGQYTSARLVNVGTNRWAVKPELGFSWPHGHWMGEVYAGGWFFSDNTDFFGGALRAQEPLAALQGHLSRTFRPRLWLAADATFYTGGRTTVNGVTKADFQRNTRMGFTLALPAGKRGAVRASWSRGVAVRIGGNFDTVAVGYQFLWF